MTFDEICQAYEVTIEGIRAAINYAEELVEQETHHPSPPMGSSTFDGLGTVQGS